MRGIWQDARYGLRTMWQQPGFTAIAVTCLALGIGVNTTIFNLANALLFRPLPVEDVESLAAVFTSNVGHEEYGITSYPDYEDLRDRNTVFEGLAAHSFVPVGLKTGDRSEIVIGQMVSWNWFSVVGVEPALGRAFLAEEDQTPGSHPVAILSHRVWERELGSDPDVLGSQVLINSHPFTVVGVTAEGFRGLHVAVAVDVWVPLHMVNEAAPFSPQFDGRIDPWLYLLGRLKPGVGFEQAGAELETLAAGLLEEHPELNEGKGFPVVAQSENRTGTGPMPGAGLQFGLLMAVVALVLVIAAFNVANMYLARAAVRQREMALRFSLGASRGRIVRQLLTESVLLALVAGAAGLLVALWTLDLIIALQPATQFPFEFDLSFDGRVLGFTLSVSCLTAMLFSLAPALQTIRPSQAAALKDQPLLAGWSPGRSRLRGMLVSTQVAISLVLLVGAGLLLRSLDNVMRVHPGFDLREGLVVDVMLGYSQYGEAEGRAFYERLYSRLDSFPGVDSVSAAAFAPFGIVHGRHDVVIEGYEPAAEEFMVPLRNMVDEDYFETMGIAVLRGRGFSARDRADSMPVAIVNETMARRYWPEGDPVGGRIVADLGVWREVVGVVSDGKYRARPEASQPYLYIPLSQAEYLEHQSFILKTSGDPRALIEPIRQEVRLLDPNLPEAFVSTIGQQLETSVAGQRAAAVLVSIFGALALVLAMVGVFGVMSYVVSQRTHEYGVRLALGAQGSEIVELVLRRGMKTTILGIALGIVLALVGARFLTSMLHEVSALDPWVFAAVPLALTVISLLACYLPARLASRVDPMVALRAE